MNVTIDITIRDCEIDELSPWLIKVLESKARRKEVKVEAPVLEPDLPPVEQPEEAPPMQETPVLDLEVVRGQLNKLKTDKGLEVVREVLRKHNVQRVPDLPAAEYEAVMEDIALCYVTKEE